MKEPNISKIHINFVISMNMKTINDVLRIEHKESQFTMRP
jgi:hypothetical protein